MPLSAANRRAMKAVPPSEDGGTISKAAEFGAPTGFSG
jgi:hypothetical protein